MTLVLSKTYANEELCDLQRDLSELEYPAEVGTFFVTITFQEDAAISFNICEECTNAIVNSDISGIESSLILNRIAEFERQNYPFTYAHTESDGNFYKCDACLNQHFGVKSIFEKG